ncbi:PAS domain S-box protein, partial [uncultured Brevundimonas sp.]|uniref:PAS domain-containing protein n=1 Tax=uncultured Brevundimonas sp. TaxID=213418 RepID=UPI0025F573D1
MSAGGSKGRIAGMDRWLVGLARLPATSASRRLLIGIGIALAGLAIRAAAAPLYGEVTGFTILLPAVTLAALAAGWTGALAALAVCTGGGWAIVALTATGRDGVLDAIGGAATWNFVLVSLFIAAVGASLRKALSRLSESETRFRELADTAPSPIWLLDAKGEFEFVNAAVFALHGLDIEGLREGGWKTAVHPDDLETVKAAEKAGAADRKPFQMEARVQGQDGVWRWMRAVVRPRFDGQGVFVGYAGISFDVTETREALDAAARAARRQAFLLDLSDRLRDLTDPEDIMADVESTLGALLDVDRVGYGEIDQAAGVVSMSRDWTAGVESAQGQFSLNAFGEGLIADLNAGRT